MTRIEVNGGRYITEESVEGILAKYKGAMYEGNLLNFNATNDDYVYLRPKAIVAIIKVGFVPAEESNSD